ncbi:MAG: rod shape-determining protein RodA [Candidatus Pacebacteria bacterium]|nr:rod shape-determining protein RodA [Candidatus Paceibacterota bacterium]
MTKSTRHLLIPAILGSFALISLITLKSIAPDLASAQLIFWLISFAVFFIASKVKISFLKKYYYIAYGALNFLLVLTLITSSITRGTARWIKFGDLFAIQPSQLAIPIVGLFLAIFASQNKLDNLINIGKFLAISLIPAVLILVEPDLGTTIHFLLSVGIILFLSEIKSKYLWTLFSIGIVGAILAWTLVLRPYQKTRITSFISSQSNQQSSENYNSYQSQIAVGSGELYGKGLGQGSQSHLRFLPERHTDFIFASFAEEWGFIGGTILIILYFILSVFLIYRATYTKNKFEYYFLIMTVTAITFQVFVNIGMNTGLLPITGVTLPFISYGGSSLVSLSLMMGVSQNIISQQKKKITMDFK